MCSQQNLWRHTGNCTAKRPPCAGRGGGGWFTHALHDHLLGHESCVIEVNITLQGSVPHICTGWLGEHHACLHDCLSRSRRTMPMLCQTGESPTRDANKPTAMLNACATRGSTSHPVHWAAYLLASINPEGARASCHVNVSAILLVCPTFPNTKLLQKCLCLLHPKRSNI